MIKLKKDLKDNFDNKLFEDINSISIEEIDEEINDFRIDKEKIDNIKYSFDKNALIKSAIDKAEKDIKKDKLRKNIIRVASVILVVLSIGIYNPALAHYSPGLMKGLEKINDFLKIDEISTILHLDTILPKALLDENNKVEFVKVTNYKVPESSSDNITISKDDMEENIILDEYEVVNFIHKMSNLIINASDGKKYGIIEITPANIEIALNSVSNINNSEARNYLTNELNKWKNGNFSNAVQVHNYVWHMLNGQVGIASSLDESKINEIVNKHFK